MLGYSGHFAGSIQVEGKFSIYRMGMMWKANHEPQWRAIA